ncbi:MAG: inositol monophosphatase family protein [Nitrospinales bacterium]
MNPALQLAIEAALEAGKIQRERSTRIGKVTYKGEIDLVTEVDLLCEKEIISRIKNQFPDHGILAEESGAAQINSEYRWIIDPLDGTVNYSHGFPSYCVSIALEKDGEIILGVIYSFCLDELFVAEKGKGSTLNSKPISVSSIATIRKSLLITGFAYDVSQSDNDNLDHFKNFVKESQAVRRMGSAALDLCYVAAGRADGFWELNLHAWDMAAGVLIIREAGGQITNFDGEEFQIDGREILATNTLLHPSMIDVLKRGKSRGKV